MDFFHDSFDGGLGGLEIELTPARMQASRPEEICEEVIFPHIIKKLRQNYQRYAESLEEAGDLLLAEQIYAKAGGVTGAKRCRELYVQKAEEIEEAGNFELAAKWYNYRKEYEKAAACYEKAQLWAMAVRQYELAEKPQDAARCYIEAKQYSQAARIYEKLKLWSEAREMYKKAGCTEEASEMTLEIFKQKLRNLLKRIFGIRQK